MQNFNQYNEFSEHMTLPLIPLTGVVFAYPKISITIDVVTPSIRAAIESSEKSGSPVFIVTQKNPFATKVETNNLYEVGTIAKIKQITRHDEKLSVTFDNVCRAITVNAFAVSGFYMCDVKTRVIEIDDVSEKKAIALLNVLKEKAKETVNVFSSPSKDLLKEIDGTTDIDYLTDLVGATVLTDSNDKYALLAEFNEYERAQLAIELMDKEIYLIKLESNIKKKAAKNIEENQKEYFLREQLKVIQAELGNDSQSEAEELYDQIKSKNFPEKIEEKLIKELVKFSKAPFGSPESAVLRTYLETCLEIPFETYTKDETSVKTARKILDRDHYGLEKVKERILEFIAVKEMNPDIKNQIICLVGPPGVGKTMIHLPE